MKQHWVLFYVAVKTCGQRPTLEKLEDRVNSTLVLDSNILRREYR